MKQIAVADLPEQLPTLLDEVARGEEVTIFRDGKAVARLIATEIDEPFEPEVTSEEMEKRRAAIGRLRAMAKARGTNFSLDEIKSWIEDGRR